MISGDRSMLAGKQGAFFYTLEELSKQWERIDVICPAISYENEKSRVLRKTYNSQLMTHNFFSNVFFHPSPHPLWLQPWWILKKGKELIAKHHHAVMTVHEYPPFYNGIGALRFSRKTGVPAVLEVHHIVGYPVAASWTERIGRMMSRFYLPRAIKKSAACRVVNKGTAQTLIGWGAPSSKIRVVPSFYLDRNLIASLGDRPTVRTDVVFCGRMVPNKGIEFLLQSLKLLPKATLLLIGDGPLRSYLQDCARDLGVAHRVEFRGWLPTQRDVLQAIRSGRMLVMNSTSEGGPRVPLEAMACGIPVIVTKVGVMPDVIEDGKNGLFTSGEPDDLAKKIGLLLDDPALRERIGDEGRRILERFERTKLIGQYAAFLKASAR
jgi:glycosyltransferase involved in cell wall biosynthesis